GYETTVEPTDPRASIFVRRRSPESAASGARVHDRAPSHEMLRRGPPLSLTCATHAEVRRSRCEAPFRDCLLGGMDGLSRWPSSDTRPARRGPWQWTEGRPRLRRVPTRWAAVHRWPALALRNLRHAGATGLERRR